MSRYSAHSLEQIRTVNSDLNEIFFRVLPLYDHKIIEGRRSKEKQNKAFENGFSHKKWPDGNHNVLNPTDPANALDAAPWPVEIPDNRQTDQENRRRFYRLYHFGGFVQGFAEAIQKPVIWGGDWNSNRRFFDQSFHDLFHFERILKRGEL